MKERRGKKIHRQFSIPILITGWGSVASKRGRTGGGGEEIREEVHVFVTYDFYDPSRSNVSLTFFSLLAFHFLYLSFSSYAKQHKK